MATRDPSKGAGRHTSSISSISSIEIWLDGHPHSADYEQPATNAIATNPDRKRHRSIHSPSRQPSKSRKLSTIPVNIMSKPEPRITRGMAASSQKTPLKKTPSRRQSTTHLPSTSMSNVHRRNSINHDQDPTPRAQPHPFKSRPPLSTPSHDDQPPSSPTSSATSAISCSHSSAPRPPSSSARSRSPTKRNVDLKLSDIAVDWVTFSTPGLSFSHQATDLLKDLRRIENGKKVISSAIQREVIQYMRDMAGVELDEEDITRWFSASGSPEYLSAKPGALSDGKVFDKAVDVTRAALRCRNHGVSEPEWNSAVHYPLLNLALEGFGLDKGIWFHDVSTARISDSSLLPAIASISKTMQSQMVDYAVVIRPSQEVERHIRSKLRANDSYSINHTDADYIRFSPIALSIETKRAAIEEDKAHRQLGTWVSAHFARLRQLVQGDSSPPFLPLIMTQGDSWNFMMAVMASAKSIVIYRDQPLGHTRSLLGVYQLLAALQRLAKWIDEQYRLWFESRVLQSERG